MQKEEAFEGGVEVTHKQHVWNRLMLPAFGVAKISLVKLQTYSSALRRLSAFSFGSNMAPQRGHARVIHLPSQTGSVGHRYALVSLKPPPINTPRADYRTTTSPALEVPTILSPSVSKHF